MILFNDGSDCFCGTKEEMSPSDKACYVKVRITFVVEVRGLTHDCNAMYRAELIRSKRFAGVVRLRRPRQAVARVLVRPGHQELGMRSGL